MSKEDDARVLLETALPLLREARKLTHPYSFARQSIRNAIIEVRDAFVDLPKPTKRIK